jgi:UDPglucose 6-dehydrogenase
MRIGILGMGVVGSAVQTGLFKLGHDICFYDPKVEKSNFRDVLDAEICFICVPSPSSNDGSCDISIVEKSVSDLNENKYHGIVAIKSTVVPRTTARLIQEYSNLKIAFVPEFLRERCAVADFIENHDLCVIGTEDDFIFSKIKEAHGNYPKKVVKLSPTEAELVKYYNNIYNATLVVLANSFYEICQHANADYTKVKEALVNRKHINDIYLQCNNNFRGFGGACLPKDTLAIATMIEEEGLDIDFFKMILSENSKYKATVYEGMREK